MTEKSSCGNFGANKLGMDGLFLWPTFDRKTFYFKSWLETVCILAFSNYIPSSLLCKYLQMLQCIFLNLLHDVVDLHRA